MWLPVAKTNCLYLDYTRWVTTEKYILFVECVKTSINHTLGAPTGWLFVCFCSSILLKLWKLTPPTLSRTIFILPWEFETVESYTITIPVITIIPDKWYFLESNSRQTALTWRLKQNSVGQRNNVNTLSDLAFNYSSPSGSVRDRSLLIGVEERVRKWGDLKFLSVLKGGSRSTCWGGDLEILKSVTV